jgi:hypothetical protein
LKKKNISLLFFPFPPLCSGLCKVQKQFLPLSPNHCPASGARRRWRRRRCRLPPSSRQGSKVWFSDPDAASGGYFSGPARSMPVLHTTALRRRAPVSPSANIFLLRKFLAPSTTAPNRFGVSLFSRSTTGALRFGYMPFLRFGPRRQLIGLAIYKYLRPFPIANNFSKKYREVSSFALLQ